MVRYADKGLMKSFRMMYSNIGLSFRETLPLIFWFCLFTDELGRIRNRIRIRIWIRNFLKSRILIRIRQKIISDPQHWYGTFTLIIKILELKRKTFELCYVKRKLFSIIQLLWKGTPCHAHVSTLISSRYLPTFFAISAAVPSILIWVPVCSSFLYTNRSVPMSSTSSLFSAVF